MREILFRGKRADNGEWVEGFAVRQPSAVQIGESSPWYISVPPIDPDDNGGYYNVLPETVEQYTGLCDKDGKNGKKIFEGDIIEFEDMLGIINFNFGCYCVKTNKPDWRARNNPAIDIIFNEYPNAIKIIGNIHDNPELLKGE